MRKFLGVVIVVVVVIGFVLAWRFSGVNKTQLLQDLQSDFNSGNLDGMIARADRVLEGTSDDIDALLAAATAYAMKGSVGFSERENGNKAIEYADRVLLISPDHSEALRIKAYAFEIQERYDEAHATYDKAIASNPNNFQALSNKGHAYDLQGNHAEAEKFYRQSLQVNPTGEHALLNVARLYIRQNKFPEAKAALEKLGESSQNVRFRAEAYQNLAELLRSDMNYPEAKVAIEKSIAFDPAVPQAWVTRGRIRMMAFIEEEGSEASIEGDIKEYANKALALNPHQAAAYTLLYDLYSGIGDTQKRDLYKQQALEAIDKDITLGQQERTALRSYLESDITVVEQPAGDESSASPPN
jgi:tetratricopeptide (TPR) repeat protein